MQDLTEFTFAGLPVRVVERDGSAWFVAKDVAGVLGYSNTNDAISRHCKGVAYHDAPTTSGMQLLRLIPEPDVYRLAIRSRLPAAEKFEEWVMGTVLPSIRQHGGYVANQENEPPELILAKALQVAQSVINANTEALAQAKAQIEHQRPAVAFYEAVAATADTITVADMAKLLGTGQKRLFAWLRRYSVLMPCNRPYQQYIDRGYFRVVERPYTDAQGRTHITFQTIITGKGQTWLTRQWQRESMQ